ncbi:MAG: response regulator [Planctomycetes bacterium]|nr:response regulator [Planctomycetota bacterium]
MFQTSDFDRSRFQLPPESAPVGAMRPLRALAPIPSMLQTVADGIRNLLDVQTAIVSVAREKDWDHALSAISCLNHAPGNAALLDGYGTAPGPLGPVPSVLRLTDEELHRQLGWRTHAGKTNGSPPAPGWLLAPLVDSQVRNVGTILLNGKRHGEFTAQDETCLVHFSRVAVLALENAWERDATVVDRPTILPPGLIELEAEIGRILARADNLTILLQDCTQAIVRRLGLALGRLWVSRGGVLDLQASAGLNVTDLDERARVPVGQFTIGHIAQTRLSHLARCIAADGDVHDKGWTQSLGLTSFAGFPLLSAGELMGVLAIYDREPISQGRFDAVAGLCRLMAMTIRRYRTDDDAELFAAPSVRNVSFDLHAEQAVIVTGPDDVIVDWNGGAARCFGYRREEALGQPVEFLVPPERAAEHRDILEKISAGVIVSRPETVRLRNDRTLVNVGLTVSALRDSAGRRIGAVWIAQNLAEIQRLEQQYRQAQKMEVFGQLAGGVAHDFNNLLTIILGYVEIVLGRLQPGDSLRELLGEIHKASQRAETLTRQLLAFSRKQTLEPKILDLNAAISDTEKMLRRLIGEDILMTTIFAPALKPIKIDPGHLQQVILNLAVNARDAMPRGGRLTIETSAAVLDQAQLERHPETPPGEFVKFALTDTGIGMNQAILARLFEPLFTTKGPGKGTGLGLATVHGIIKQYGGFIDVASEFGRGSTFSVFLPSVAEPLSLGKTSPHPRMIPNGAETVLVVEDENTVRALVRQVLLACGYTVHEAANGEEALGIATKLGNKIQLLVSDVVMPHLGGRSLADRLIQINPEIRVLFLSGYTNDAVSRYGILDAEFAFLQKPFTTSALAQKVREVLDQPTQRAGN